MWRWKGSDAIDGKRYAAATARYNANAFALVRRSVRFAGGGTAESMLLDTAGARRATGI